jgi:hypothetical protein
VEAGSVLLEAASLLVRFSVPPFVLFPCARRGGADPPLLFACGCAPVPTPTPRTGRGGTGPLPPAGCCDCRRRRIRGSGKSSEPLQGCSIGERSSVTWSGEEMATLGMRAFPLGFLGEMISLFARLISHQPAVRFSQNESATSNQPQPASSTLLSEQTSTSHQPPANRTSSMVAVVLDLHSESLVMTPRLLVRDNVDEQTAGSAWGSDQWCGGASW